jgi:hypothetical protein
LELHAFGPLVAACLVGWSALAIEQRRFWPALPRIRRAVRPLTLAPVLVLALVGYWLMRLTLLGFPGGGAGGLPIPTP